VRGAQCGEVCWELGVQHTTPHKAPHTHTHTKLYDAALPQINFTVLEKSIKTFKLSDFNKERTSSLKMI